MKRPSMRKIAALAGVSVAAVSYAIHDKPGISPQTKQRILQIMEDEQYAPLSPGTGKPQAQKYLYLVIDDLSCFSNVFYSSILDTITTTCTKYGYDVVLCNQAHTFRATTAAAAIRQGLAAGMIFFHDIPSETLEYLHRYETPFVIIDAHYKTADIPHIGVDYETAVFTATQHLIDLGHRDLAFLGQKELDDFYHATFRGFSKALRRAGLSLQPQWVKDSACDFNSAYACMEQLLQTAPLPTGIVCAADQFALAAMRCAQDHGFSVPKDFSVVGVDDLPISRFYYPSLTSVHIDVSHLAEQAVESLHSQIIGNGCAVRTVCSDRLIIRASTSAK